MKLVADIVITGILNGAKPLSKLLALRGSADIYQASEVDSLVAIIFRQLRKARNRNYTMKRGFLTLCRQLPFQESELLFQNR